MRKRILVSIIIGASVLMGSPNQDSILVVPLTYYGLRAVTAQAVSDTISRYLARSGLFKVLTKEKRADAAEFVIIDIAVCHDADCLLQLGQRAGVMHVVGSRVSRENFLYTVELLVVDVDREQTISTIVERTTESSGLFLAAASAAERVLVVLAGDKDEIPTATATLKVSSMPPGGTIALNDVVQAGITPHIFTGLTPGIYMASVRLDNLVAEELVYLDAGESEEISLHLAQETMMLRIFSIPLGADVFLGGRFIGRTPLYYPKAKSDLAYPISISMLGYRTVNDAISVKDDPMVTRTYHLEPQGTLSLPRGQLEAVIDNRPLKDYEPISEPGKWTINGLDYREYEIWIGKPYFQPASMSVTLSALSPHLYIEPLLVRKRGTIIMPATHTATKLLVHQENAVQKILVPLGGKYAIDLPYGEYRINARAAGFEPYTEKLNLFTPVPLELAFHYKPISHRKAVVFSLLYPGGGQLYSQQKRKSIVMGALASLCLGWAVYANTAYQSETATYEEYKTVLNRPLPVKDVSLYTRKLNSSWDRMNSFYNQFIGTVAIATGTYLWNILDIVLMFPERETR